MHCRFAAYPATNGRGFTWTLWYHLVKSSHGLRESADDIAKALGRKKKTIEWHIEQTRTAWGVHSRAAINTILLTTAWRIQMRRLGEGP